jgi:hypothetical protein
VRAGEDFTVTVSATTQSGQLAPSFGSEGSGSLWRQVHLYQVPQDGLPVIQGAFDGAKTGIVTGKFRWDEAGYINLTPVLDDYLDTGSVPGAALVIGRFYPDHFDTATRANFACLARMACPTGVKASGESLAVTGAAYSGQQFAVDVSAVGLQGNHLLNYSGGTITLAAYDSPAGTGLNPGGVGLTDFTRQAVANTTTTLTPSYQLKNVFSNAKPRALNWTTPTAIYLRASASDTRVVPGGASEAFTITSKRATGTIEGGITIINGRLQLSNGFGSELLKLPVHIAAQYWTGTLWDSNSGDSTSPIGSSMRFTECQNKLATGDGSDNCKLSLVKLATAPGPLKDGAGTLWLQAPGRGNIGSAYLQVTDGNPAWLPSTRARATFGVYKSPLIYLREVY